MKRSLSRFLMFCALAVWLAAPQGVPANSLSDFFKKLGNSIAHPQKRAVSDREREGKRKVTGTTDTTPTPTPSPAVEPPVRTASVVTGPKDTKRDIPYGIPVAEKPGFVTSPYAPGQGWVDVRGIPSGTEVKDPFSGKSFLTP